MSRFDARPMTRSRCTTGLTLVELLIVLFIVGLGWFTLLPRLDPTRPSGSSAPLHEVNLFLAQVRNAAIATGRFQTIQLEPASGVLSWNEATHRLQTPPSRCALGGSPCTLPATRFRVYSQGHMDRLQLDFMSGERWTTADLDARLVNEFQP